MEGDTQEISVFADIVGQLTFALDDEKDRRMFAALSDLIRERLVALEASRIALFGMLSRNGVDGEEQPVAEVTNERA